MKYGSIEKRNKNPIQYGDREKEKKIENIKMFGNDCYRGDLKGRVCWIVGMVGARTGVSAIKIRLRDVGGYEIFFLVRAGSL